MAYWSEKVAVITGGSAGFGKVLAAELLAAGARVVIAARNQQRLSEAVVELGNDPLRISACPADVTRDDQVEALLSHTLKHFGRLDVLVNNAGRSSRGNVLDTTVETFREHLELNFLSAARCTRAAAPYLIESSGHLVNVGSLASKTATRYLAAYPASKFALAAYTQQVRLELAPRGVHVLLVCPGPIARDGGEERYSEQTRGLPAAASRPGGGVKLQGLPPQQLAARVMTACQQRRPELVLPGRARLLFALAQLSPQWGDWITTRLTSGRQS